MRLLYISNLFPNPREPVKGMFNAQQVQALSKLCRVTVIAPTAQAMPTEQACGVRVLHPKFFHLPVVTRPFNGWLFARAIEPEIRKGGFDCVLASWAYPDGYGVMLLAQKYGFPFAVDVLGSDINCFFSNSYRKKQILRTLRASNVVFAKSRALAERLAKENIKAEIDYNGIDRSRFRLLNRVDCCRQLGLDPQRKRILYVGNLAPVKGPMVLAQAFRLLIQNSIFCCHPERIEGSPANLDLVYIGSGSERNKVAKILGVQSSVFSLQSNVMLAGSRPHTEIALWMNACDLLCLPSLNEGLPNVALEALACGLPVVASKVGGVPEIVYDGMNGFTVPTADPATLATALQRALNTRWDHDAIRQSVSVFDWNLNARTVFDILQKITIGKPTI